MTLRQRLMLTFAPLIVLLTLLGAAGVVLLLGVGNRINLILHENYDSIVYMVTLNEALERIDSSFNIALLGKEEEAKQAYAANTRIYKENLQKERNNITVPGEAELVADLVRLSELYDAEGNQFFAAAPSQRRDLYLGNSKGEGLVARFGEIKKVANAIRDLNEQNMLAASRSAHEAAVRGRNWLALGLILTAILAAWLAWRTVRATTKPLEALTESALAIGAGNLNQMIETGGPAELQRLAQAFNRMTSQLRDYRQAASTRLLRAQRTGQATIDAFADPVVVIDPGGRVEMANPAARRVLGVAPAGEQVNAVPWQPPDVLRKPLDEALRQQRPFITRAFDETCSFRLGGEEHAYLPQIFPIADPYGNTLGAAVVLSDVTRFRLLDQVKTNLVATVSHELKTPLTSVRLALHLLLEEAVGPLTPKQLELLVDARDNAEKLLSVIEHLLALARLEEGREALEKTWIKPEDLLKKAIEQARPRAENKHIALKMEADPDLSPIHVDPQRFRIALDNLLDNAIQYTEEGGHITCTAQAADHRVQLVIADSGLGIPEECLPRLFEKFYRVPGQSRGDGTGLGLAIVQEIVTAHQGLITVESHPGKGTTFRIYLPVANEGATACHANR